MAAVKILHRRGGVFDNLGQPELLRMDLRMFRANAID